MYVRRTDGFGSFGERSSHDPFAEDDRGMVDGGDGDWSFTAALESMGLTEDVLITTLTACSVRAIRSGATAGGECLWSTIQPLISAAGDSALEPIYEMIASADCSTTLAGLGIPDTLAAIVCGIEAATAGVWSAVQDLASSELMSIYRERGGRRPDAEGGGFRLVNAAGELVGIDCDGSIIDPSSTCGPAYDPSTPPDSSPKAPLVIRAAPHTLSLVTLTPGHVTGRVVGPGGNPVTGAEIRVGSLANAPAGRTDAMGRFDVRVGAIAHQRIFVHADGYDDMVLEDVPVTQGGASDLGDVALTSNRSKSDTGGGIPTWAIVTGVVVLGGAGLAFLIYRVRK